MDFVSSLDELSFERFTTGMNKLMQLAHRTSKITKMLFFVIIAAILLAGLIAINPHKTFADTSTFGNVYCVNGTVDGVWIQDLTHPSYSGWGYKLSYYGLGSPYNWKKTVYSLGDKYRIHMGCNGVWANSSYIFSGYYNQLFAEQAGNTLWFSLTAFQ